MCASSNRTQRHHDRTGYSIVHLITPYVISAGSAQLRSLWTLHVLPQLDDVWRIVQRECHTWVDWHANPLNRPENEINLYHVNDNLIKIRTQALQYAEWFVISNLALYLGTSVLVCGVDCNRPTATRLVPLAWPGLLASHKNLSSSAICKCG